MYNVYVIELERLVLKSSKFRNANPHRRDDKPCVYVGSTVRSPEERFKQHKEGYKANRFVHQYGVRLKPRLYRNYQGYKTRKEAEEKEKQRAESLRKRGYAVWYGV